MVSFHEFSQRIYCVNFLYPHSRYISCSSQTSWFNCSNNSKVRSQWPRDLRLGSAAARLLGLRVRIPPGHGYLSLVIVVCCQVGLSALGWSLVQRSPTECGVSECDREASIMRRPWLTRGCCVMGKKTVVSYKRVKGALYLIKYLTRNNV
jgi:hypothetical protein